MVRGTKDVLPAFRGAQMASEDKMWRERNGMAEHVGGAPYIIDVTYCSWPMEKE